MRWRRWLAALAALVVAILVGRGLARPESLAPLPPVPEEGLAPVVADIDAAWQRTWDAADLHVGHEADRATIARRMSLALVGSIPSLEDLRRLESAIEDAGDARHDLLERFAEGLLADRRFAEYWAERLARAYAPAQQGDNFVLFRRRRFVTWLADQIHANRPYDAIVRDMIASEGTWTSRPATNFITAHEADPNRLAERTTRAFLGLRIDCAQCHDHPFSDWKQSDFQRLAAFYGRTRISFSGVRDNAEQIEVRDVMSQEVFTPDPGVPFAQELLPTDSGGRAALAEWITHPGHPYFARAMANRVWRLLYGRGLIEPVDDLEQAPVAPEMGEILDILAQDWVEHDYDLKRLIRLAIQARTFRQSSAFEVGENELAESRFVLFPASRLRTEQIVYSLIQTQWLHTLDHDSHWVKRLAGFFQTREFLERFGDAGEEELLVREGNLPQTLLLLNNRLVEERAKASPFSSGGRIAEWATSDDEAVRLAFTICLTRAPTAEELEYFSQSLAGARGKRRQVLMEDLYWALINSTEFAWNR